MIFLCCEVDNDASKSNVLIMQSLTLLLLVLTVLNIAVCKGSSSLSASYYLWLLFFAVRLSGSDCSYFQQTQCCWYYSNRSSNFCSFSASASASVLPLYPSLPLSTSSFTSSSYSFTLFTWLIQSHQYSNIPTQPTPIHFLPRYFNQQQFPTTRVHTPSTI